MNDADKFDGRIDAVTGAAVQAFAERYFRQALGSGWWSDLGGKARRAFPDRSYRTDRTYSRS